MSDKSRYDKAGNESTTVYVTKDEFWPWYNIGTDDTYAYEDEAYVIPTELWRSYEAASAEYWKLKRRILEIVEATDSEAAS